jgi:CheY-like chemotaxis protein
MRKHDGHMTVASQEGVGTTVRIYQPASRQPLAPTPAPPAPPLVGSGRILVMDDEEMICDLLQALLASLGHEVVCVRDGTEALEVYQQARATGQMFAAVILDHTIPGGRGGVDTMARLRALDPQVKAVISSGYANGPVMANWTEYGFRGVIPKPYTIERLQAALARLFQEGETVSSS